MIKCILIIVFSFFFYSCKELTPSGVIKPRVMQDILWDVMRADALAQEISKKDSTLLLAEENMKLTKKVFLIHDVTQEQFEKSFSYYSQNPDKMKIILDSLNARQQRAAATELLLEKKPFLKDSVQINK